jgi:hypothetical protein
MLVELGVFWVFLTLLSGVAVITYVWERHSDATHAHSDDGQGLRPALSRFSPWSVDRDNHA